MYSCQFTIRFYSRRDAIYLVFLGIFISKTVSNEQYSEFKVQSLKKMRWFTTVLTLFCWSGTLKDLPMKPRTRQFSGVSAFRCGRTFRASFARGKFIFHALFLSVCLHLTLISVPRRLAKTDSSVNGEPLGGGIQIPETWAQVLLPLFPYHPPYPPGSSRRACL